MQQSLTGSISESAVQPRNVRNTEHLVVLSTVYSSTSITVPHAGIILRQIAIKDVGENALIRCRKQPAFQRRESVCAPRPLEVVPGGRRRIRSG